MKTQSNDLVYPLVIHGGIHSRGLTKREYFAALAMQGMVSRTSVSYKETAGRAVSYADALIKELNNE